MVRDDYWQLCPFLIGADSVLCSSRSAGYVWGCLCRKWTLFSKEKSLAPRPGRSYLHLFLKSDAPCVSLLWLQPRVSKTTCLWFPVSRPDYWAPELHCDCYGKGPLVSPLDPLNSSVFLAPSVPSSCTMLPKQESTWPLRSCLPHSTQVLTKLCPTHLQNLSASLLLIPLPALLQVPYLSLFSKLQAFTMDNGGTSAYSDGSLSPQVPSPP